jgi:hypothetical protein
MSSILCLGGRNTAARSRCSGSLLTFSSFRRLEDRGRRFEQAGRAVAVVWRSGAGDIVEIECYENVAIDKGVPQYENVKEAFGQREEPCASFCSLSP